MYKKESGLPEPVRQTGPIKGDNRVYIEDYAYSFLRELKKQEKNVPMRVAMYGKAFRKEEGHVYLIYGVAPAEAEAHAFFRDYEMLGYINLCNLDNSREGQNGCFVFYETNAAMQEYLLSRNREGVPQEVAFFYKEETNSDKEKGRASAIVRLIQKLLLSVALLLVVVAVTTINRYNDMCGFVIMVAKATLAIP